VLITIAINPRSSKIISKMKLFALLAISTTAAALRRPQSLHSKQAALSVRGGGLDVEQIAS